MTECWNDWCIASSCNGKDHVDVTGYSWTEEKGSIYNPLTGNYEVPDWDIDSCTAITRD